MLLSEKEKSEGEKNTDEKWIFENRTLGTITRSETAGLDIEDALFDRLNKEKLNFWKRCFKDNK